MGKIVKYNLPCKECGSSDAVVLYEDGGKFCHKCQSHDNSGKSSGYAVERPKEEFMDANKVDLSFYYEAEFKAITDRRLDEATCKKFGVRTTATGSHLFPMYNDKEELVAVKERFYPEKRFKIHKADNFDGNILLFGQKEFAKTGRNLTITEGEYDAMAAYKMSGSKYPHVSVFNGSGSAVRECKDNFEALMQFDNIILNFDADKAGTEAIEKVGPIFVGKAKVLQLTEGKDACDYLKANKISKYVDEFHRARKYTLGGLINGADTWEKYKEEKNVVSIPFPDDWKDLNQKTYGIRMGEIVLFTAGTGTGKSQILRELKYHYLVNHPELKMLDIALEEGLGTSVGGLMALEANKRIHLPDVHISEEEEKAIHKKLYGDGRITFMDHEGSMDDTSLLDKIEYSAVVDGTSLVFLDHITIAVSDCEIGSENLSMDKFMNRLLKLVKRLKICVIVVSHLRKVGGGGKSFEEGRIPTEDDLKGSGSLKQIAMTTIAMARNKYAEDDVERNTTSLHSLKCRFSGRTGPCDYLHFEDETGRMVAIDPLDFEKQDNEFKDEVLGG